jgi:flavodoxin
VWRHNIGWFVEKYRKWSAYEPEEDAVLIACGSIYGGTMNAAEILAARLQEDGVKNVALYDVSVTHPSTLVAEAFRCSHLVFASATYNTGLFPNMETLLLDLKAHNLQNRTAALIENGTWAPTAGALMRETLASMSNMTILDGTVNLRSSVKAEQREQLLALADALAATLPATAADESRIDAKADGAGRRQGQRLHHQHRHADHQYAQTHHGSPQQSELHPRHAPKIRCVQRLRADGGDPLRDFQAFRLPERPRCGQISRLLGVQAE